MSDAFARLSDKEYLVFDLLVSAARPLYGLQLVQKADGALPRGTVYVLLNRMEKKGYIRSMREEPKAGASGIPRRHYEPTGFGAKVFQLSQQLHSLGTLRLAHG